MKEMLALFPTSTQLDEQGQLWLGGCLTLSLAQEFGTPLYVFDEATIRLRCRAYRQALARHYPGPAEVAYAGKAYLNLALAQLFDEEGLSLDVVSGGELYVARKAGVSGEHIHFHGNNKTTEELIMALDEGVGRIVVDNFEELDALKRLAAEQGIRVPIWLRLSPNIDVHTHVFRKTGLLDSKFGFPLETDDAAGALHRARASRHLDLVGLHAHIGSQIFDPEPLALAATRLLDFAAAHNFAVRELSPGGGWAVPYRETDSVAPIKRYAEAVCRAVVDGCRRHGLSLPKLTIEPGRSIVAPAGVALYRVGARKEISGVRTYVSVDGGIADNIRPALYGARYTAVVANRAHLPAEETVTVAGRFCESGDVLIRDIALPRLKAGDLLAIPMTGAYCLPMASNYNLVPRPAVVMVSEGRANLIQRRETFQDLSARDLPLPQKAASSE